MVLIGHVSGSLASYRSFSPTTFPSLHNGLPGCHLLTSKPLLKSPSECLMIEQFRASGPNRELMGNVPSQDEAHTIGDQSSEKRERHKKKIKHSKHKDMSDVDQENTRGDPSQLEHQSRRHKSKHSKSGKRRKKSSKLDSEHSKEEESARTLLEMKGAAAVSNTFEQDSDLVLSSQAATDNRNHDGPAHVGVHADGRERHKRKKSKREDSQLMDEDHGGEQGAAMPTGNGSIPDTSHISELPPTTYPGPADPTQPFHPTPEGRHPTDRFASSQRTAQDDTIVHTYGDMSEYADSGFRAGTPSYDPEASPPFLQPTEFAGKSPHGTNIHRRKRRDSQTHDLDSRNDDTITSGRRGKRRKGVDPGEAHNALLADAASAANALIDPVLTGQPPLWTIIDGKTAYMGQITNGAPAESAQKDSAGRRPGSRKKRRTPAGGLSEADPAAGSQKPKRKAKKSTVPQVPAATNGVTGQVVMTKGGPFSEHEENLLKQFMDDYRLENNWTEYQLNERVWADRRNSRDDFWDQVSAVLAYRPRQSIYKYCRRQFHNFPKRGQWTADEDEELIAAAKEHPQQWKKVGSILNRMPEDCRDRWRNYLKCGEARKKDVWTEQEEKRLKQHVLEVMAALGGKSGNVSAACDDVLADDNVDKKAALINWTIVSEKMGGTRSRIQCSYKWKKLQKIAAREKEKAEVDGDGTDAEPQPKKTWRARRAEGNFFKMLPGDKYDLLKALKDSGTYEEKNIPWKLVGSPEFCKTWNLTDRKTAFKFLKENVPDHENMTLQDIVDELLRELNEYSPEVLSLRYVAPPTPLRQAKKSEHQQSEVTTDDGELAYHQDSSHGVYDPPQNGVAADQGLDGQSGDYRHQLSMEGDGYLGPGVDERMAQQVQLLRHV